MKASRSYLMVVGFSLGACALVLMVALQGYFRALEQAGSQHGSEKRLVEDLAAYHRRVAKAESPEQARAELKSLESFVSSGPDSESVERVRKTYAPVVAAFGSKPKEADERFLLVKKREAMEALVNAYRKEITGGDIRLRAAYLNVLFDTQNSLLNENEQVEEVYQRRSKERMAGLRGMAAGSGDASLQARVANVEGIFQGMEKGLEARNNWLAQKNEALTRAEKSLPKLARDLRGTRDDEFDGHRRFFLYTCIVALLAFLGAAIAIYVNHKMMRMRFDTRLDSLLRFLREFGRERSDPSLERELKETGEDPDWGPLMAGGLESERDFISKHQTLIAVPRSMGCGYLVIDKDQVVRHWNEPASQLFGLTDGPEVTLPEIARRERMAPREGDSVDVVDMILASFNSPKEDVFELVLNTGAEWVPVEILSDPVRSGPLAGGKVFLVREIRNEAARIDRAVASHLADVRDRVRKITHGYPISEDAPGGLHPQVAEAQADLNTMKRKIDERETLWKSEAEALTDQVVRQKDFLSRLTGEIKQLRDAQAVALELVGTLHGGEESWHDEVCVLDRELVRWQSQRKRLESDLGKYGAVMEKARKYESEVRVSTAGLNSFLEGYEGVLKELRRFSEEAKVQAVNLSFAKDPALWEFASRSRAYANEIGRFVEQAASLAGRVHQFVDRHPGNSLAPHLESSPLDESVLLSLKEEEERFSTFLKRWKESGSQLVDGGEQAVALLREAEKKTAICNQLGETVLLINDQAQENLGRWS